MTKKTGGWSRFQQKCSGAAARCRDKCIAAGRRAEARCAPWLRRVGQRLAPLREKGWYRRLAGLCGKARARYQGAKSWQQGAFLSLILVLCTVIAISVPADALRQAGDARLRTLQLEVDDSAFLADGTVRIGGLWGLNQGYLERNVRLTPNAKLEITKESADDDTALLRILNPGNRRYTLELRGPMEEWHTIELGGELLDIQSFPEANGYMHRKKGVRFEFSSPPDQTELNTLLKVSPETPYTLSFEDNSVFVTPKEEWRAGTYYAITIPTEYARRLGLTMRQNEVYTFRTEGSSVRAGTATVQKTPSISLSAGGRRQTLTPDLNPAMVFNCTDMPSGKVAVVVHVWRMDSLDQYFEQADIFQRNEVDLAFLTRAQTKAFVLEDGENHLELAPLEEGGYILEAIYTHPVTEKVTSVRQPLLISDLSVYMQSSQGETLVWLNRPEGEQALSGYRVAFTGLEAGQWAAHWEEPGEDEDEEQKEVTVSALTGTDGTAMLDYLYDPHRWDGNKPTQFQVYDPEGRLIYTDVSQVLGDYDRQRDRYYSYLYLDRPLYKPTDTISFWGVVQPFHTNEAPMPDSVFVYFDEGGLDMELEVPLDAGGVFTGEFQLESIVSSQYHISTKLKIPVAPKPAEDEAEQPEDGAEDEGEPVDDPEPEIQYVIHHLDEEYVDVKEYEKPLYTISSTVDRSWYTHDGMVTVTAVPAFYDGTPLPNYAMEFSIYRDHVWTSPMTVYTDENGVATATFPVMDSKTIRDNSWRPRTGNYQVRIAADGQNIEHYGAYTYFAVPALAEADILRSQGGGTRLRLQANEMTYASLSDLANVHAYSEDSLRQMLRGEALNEAEVQFDVSYYRYGRGYSYNNDGSFTVSGTLQNGSLELGGLEELQEMDSRLNAPWVRAYHIRVEYTFTWEGYTFHGYADHHSSSWSYYSRYWGREESEVYPGFSMAVYNSQGDDITEPYQEYYPHNSVTLGSGEAVTLRLLDHGEPVEPADDARLLVTYIQDRVIHQEVLPAASAVSFTQQPRYASTVNVVVAYYDGRNVHSVRDTMITFDTESAQLDFTVTTDQDSYRPGDTVNLTVRAADQNGNGVAGNLVVSVVDEAVFALREQHVRVLGSLYGEIYFSNYYIRKYTSLLGDHRNQESYDEGKGGGDSLAFYDSFRSEFRDTAAFLPLRTDSSGLASTQFTLPDNITSWRFTTVGIGDNLYAGSAKENHVSSLPFFMSPVLNSKYIAGDDVAMQIQGYGTLLDADSRIDYRVELEGADMPLRIFIGSGPAFLAKQVNFGALPEGDYTLRATATLPYEDGAYSDTVELPFSVIASNLELVIHRQVDLGAPLDLKETRYPVLLTVYDEANHPFFSSVSSLFGHYCMQASQRMSRFVAKRALSRFMDPEDIPGYIRQGNDSATEMQNPDGGIGYGMGAESDLYITAMLALIAGDQYDHQAMARYFRRRWEANPKDVENRALCLMGLAAIGEPVREDIERALEQYAPLGAQSHLVAGLALLDPDAALALYEEQLAPRVNLNLLNDQGRQPENVAAVWVPASVLNHPDADTISLHYARYPWRIGTLFECMVYVTYYNREVVPKTLVYAIGDQEYTLNLGLGGARTLKFSQQEFAALRMVEVDEHVTAMAYYVGEPDENSLVPSQLMEVSKSVTKADGRNHRISITIRFDKDAPYGQYDISEWIPSNMTLYEIEYTKDRHVYSTTEEHKIYFTYYRQSGENEVTISYLARKTFDADAVLDATYVIHGDTGENCRTEKDVLELG